MVLTAYNPDFLEMPRNYNKQLISVIMPCFNAESYIEYAIESVFKQTYPNIELIVVNDGSNDESAKILKRISKKSPTIRVFHNQNQGPYPARNFALQQAKGEYIAFLDADDYWSSDCLETLYYKLVHSKSDICYCGWQNIVENGTNQPSYIPPNYQENDIVINFLKGCPWPIHAALTRKKIIDQVQGFSTRYFSAMDYDLWIRILAITQKITLAPKVLAYYRWHDQGQISSVKWKQVLNARQVRYEFIQNNPCLVSHIENKKLSFLVNEQIVIQAYNAFWKRDLNSAQHLYRAMARYRYWKLKDVKYIFFSLLPSSLFKEIIKIID